MEVNRQAKWGSMKFSHKAFASLVALINGSNGVPVHAVTTNFGIEQP